MHAPFQQKSYNQKNLTIKGQSHCCYTNNVFLQRISMKHVRHGHIFGFNLKEILQAMLIHVPLAKSL